MPNAIRMSLEHPPWPLSGRMGLTAKSLWISAIFIAGCAAEKSTVNERDGVKTSVIASTAGLGWSRQPTSGLVIKIGNFDGTNSTFSWPPAVAASADQLAALSSCLENLQMSVRFPDPANLTQPHFIESAAIHCFESSGMPAYVIAHERDANELPAALVKISTLESRIEDLQVQLNARIEEEK